MTEPEIVIDRVSKVYKAESSDPVFALEETTLKVARGKFVCVLGPSGCGKSTLLSMVAGLIRPSSGSIRVAGARVSGPGPEGYAANAILVRIERWALSWKQDAQGAEIV